MNIAIERYKELWRNGVIIYGMGKIGIECFNYLRNELGINIIAICDRRDICYNNMKSITYEALSAYPKDSNIIVTIRNKDGRNIINTLKEKFINVYDVRDIYFCKYYFPNYVFEEDIHQECRPFNHFESPYPDLKYIFSQEDKLFSKDVEVKDVNLNELFQISLFDKMKKIYADMPDWTAEKIEKYRYYFKNDHFSLSDAKLLNFMIRENRPKRIVEIGSGMSTCVMLDTNDNNLEYSLDITCIEPYPERLMANIKNEDVKRIQIHRNFVQDIDENEFANLEENDILFIDSSHVVRTGGDVNYEYFNILPKLKKGVIIHIHDMFWPFEYPKDWVKQGRVYGELYLVRALLMNSEQNNIRFCFLMI